MAITKIVRALWLAEREYVNMQNVSKSTATNLERDQCNFKICRKIWEKMEIEPFYFHFSFSPWRRFVIKPKYWAVCLLLHHLAVRISLPFHIFLYVNMVVTSRCFAFCALITQVRIWKSLWVENSTSLRYLPIPWSAETCKIFTNMLCHFFFFA